MPDPETGGNVKAGLRITLFFGALIVPIIMLVIWPPFDLVVSGLFYRVGEGFFLAENPVLVVLHTVATKGGWALGIVLLTLTLIAVIKQKPVFEITPKSYMFLLLALVIGPVLIANVGFKDHWGRARPREVINFGGTSSFTPALAPQPNPHSNGSFVAGDGAFGFYLPTLAYVPAIGENGKRRRRVFYFGLIAAFLFSLARLLMGAHFLSDILFAALFMLASSAALHAVMFGKQATMACWKNWFGEDA